MTFEVLIVLLAIALIHFLGLAHLIAILVVTVIGWSHSLLKLATRSQPESQPQSEYRADMLHRLEMAITVFLTIGALCFAYWFFAPVSSTSVSPTQSIASEAQKPDSDEKSKWHFSFTDRKTDDPKPTGDKAEEEKSKSRWKIEFKKSDEADEPAKQHNNDAQ